MKSQLIHLGSLLLCLVSTNTYAQWSSNGSNTIFNLTGKVGIGTQLPDGKLDVRTLSGRGIYSESNSSNISEAALYARNKNSGVAVYAEGNVLYGVYGFSWKSHGIVGNYVNNNKNYAGYFMGPVFSTSSFVVSDRKLKTDIQPLDEALVYINALKPKSYLFDKDRYPELNLPEGQHFGLLADELEEVFPTLVRQNESLESPEKTEKIEFKVVNYQELVPVLVKGIQEQQQTINQLTSRIEKLEKQLSLSTLDHHSEKISFSVSPNPAQSEISVKILSGNLGSFGKIVLSDMSGKELKHIRTDNNKQSYIIDISDLTPGIYNCSIIFGSNLPETKKFVIIK